MPMKGVTENDCDAKLLLNDDEFEKKDERIGIEQVQAVEVELML